ncbi:phytoene desaturase family protein [Bacteroides sedimenti]|uniref:Amine oxidase domain-containing protein n=1 Tax=Bacteroides sedimenti TaxID=2136147 RepID=A0ABN6Z2K6_9BACE
MSKKVLIIGGGIAGLSAGIYAAMNGFETEIIEMHSVAGGQCTAWDRKGYRFDYCLHWLIGTAKGAFHEIWKETNVINNETEIIDHEIHSRILDEEGNEFIIYSNIDRWEKYLVELAPEDKASIQRMCTDMRKSALLEPFALPPELRSPLDYIRILPQMLPVFNVIRKFGKLSCNEYFEKLKFKNKRLKSVFFSLYGNRNFSALAFIFMLGWFNQKNAGYIKGGSYPMAQRMVEKLNKLGGVISYKKKVEKVIVENSVAKGVLLTDGTTIDADYVIGTADGYTTIFKMLDAKYMSQEIDFAYKNWELFTPIVQVSFGVNKAIPSICPIVINMSKDKMMGNTKLENGYSIMNYSFDPTLAPEGKTTIVLRFDSPWKLWESMDEQEYKAEKLQIQKDATACLEKEYPGITEFIEVIDVATPKTDVEYTGVKDGAYEGFMPTKDNLMKSLKMQLPGLKNFYMAGQWLSPGGGLPPSAQTGKWAVQLICKKEKQQFVSDK